MAETERCGAVGPGPHRLDTEAWTPPTITTPQWASGAHGMWVTQRWSRAGRWRGSGRSREAPLVIHPQGHTHDHIQTSLSRVYTFHLVYDRPAGPRPATAHCDGLDGPVVTLAREALETGNVHLVLPSVPTDDEAEIRRAFDHTRAVRQLGPEAKASRTRIVRPWSTSIGRLKGRRSPVSSRRASTVLLPFLPPTRPSRAAR